MNKIWPILARIGHLKEVKKYEYIYCKKNEK